MSILKLIFIMVYTVQIYISKNIENIQFVNKLEKSFSIKQIKTYEITFNSMENIPDFIHISLSSKNNIEQIVSFSSKNEKCLNANKYSSNNGNFYLEKSQLSLKKNFICVECPYPFEYCEFKMSLLEGKFGFKLEEKEEKEEKKNFNLKQKQNLKIFEKNEKDDDIILKISANTTIDIFTLNSNYLEKIKIPSDRRTFYQIDSKENGEYKIISGQSVTVSNDGMIYPKN